MNKIESAIVLHNFALDVFLGWTSQERSQKQTIVMDLKIQFLNPPSGCLTDNLNDTICYDQLIQAITASIASQPVRLLEHLSYEIYRIIKNFIIIETEVGVRVRKMPAIKNLSSAAFEYCDGGLKW